MPPSPTSCCRIQARAVWELLIFILNGIIFIVIGLQFGFLRSVIPPNELNLFTLNSLVISATAIAARLLWIPLAAWMPRFLIPSVRARDPMPRWPCR